jgi:hypothetical protein
MVSSSSSSTSNEQYIRDYTFNNAEVDDNDGNVMNLNIAESPITGGLNVEVLDQGAVAGSLDLAEKIVENAEASIDTSQKTTNQALEALRSVFPQVAQEKLDDKTMLLIAFGVAALVGIMVLKR